MANNLKRILAVIMAMSMTFSMLSVGAAATEDDGTEPAIELATLELPEGFESEITVPYGTPENEVGLPDYLIGTLVQDSTESEDLSEPEGSDSEGQTEGSDSEGQTEGSDSEGQTEGSDNAETEILMAKLVSYSGPEVETVNVPVTWACETIYSAVVASGYVFKAILDSGYSYDGTFEITVTVNQQAEYVAAIGEVKYQTLSDAAAAAVSGDTITLLSDICEGKGVGIIANGQNTAETNGVLDLTIDMAGHTIYCATNQGEGASSSSIFTAVYDTSYKMGTLTIKNGTFKGVDIPGYRINSAISCTGNLVMQNCVVENTTAEDYGTVCVRNSLHGVSVTLENCEFINNYTKKTGTICVEYNVNTTMDNVKFENNYAGWYGGAIYVTCNDRSEGGKVEIQNSEFVGNQSGYDGGAVYIGKGQETVLTNNKFTDNHGNRSGGAVHVIGGTTTIQSSEFTDNSAGENGGAIYTADGGTVTTQDSDFTYNRADKNGGALYSSNGTLEINGNLMNNAAGQDGGAICMYQYKLDFTGNMSGNTAGGNGGALFSIWSVIALNGQVVDNSAAFGGGIYAAENTFDDAFDGKINLLETEAYNNEASDAGADIWLGDGNQMDIKAVGDNWTLTECGHVIDGWYYDGQNARWTENNGWEFELDKLAGTAYVDKAVALKAAHSATPLDPGDPALPDWEISKSKTATNLDSNYESQVTLALPAAGYEPVIDVVFVIDDSHAGKTIFDDQVSQLLDELSAKENLQINLGIVTFDAVARDWISATSGGAYSGLVSIKDEAGRQAIDNAVKASLTYENSGEMKKVGATNLEWPLDMATQMLAEGEGTEKYLFVFSDLYGYVYRGDLAVNGVTYEDVPVTKFFNAWGGGSLSDETKYETFDQVYQAYLNQEGSSTPDGFFRMSSWDTYWNNYRSETPSTPTADEMKSWEGGEFTALEYSLAMTYERFVEAASVAHVTVVNNDFALGDCKNGQKIKNEMVERLEDLGVQVIKTPGTPGETEMGEIFSQLKDELIQLVDAGSKVVDIIGYGNDYNFDFVNDINKLTLTVNGTALPKTELVDPQFSDPYVTSAYGFGDDQTGYDFILLYYADGQDGKSDECFVWEINVPVTKDTPVQLTYSVKLTNPQSASGTYGQYDADGSEKYSGLYTNASATLYPVDSNGNQGIAENFAKPTVSYTISGGGSSGGGGGTVTPDPDPGTDIEDPDTPLDPGPGGETDIEDPDTPLDPGTDIEDPDTPLGNLPQTGVAEAVNPYMTAGLMALAAAMTMAGLYLSRKRGKREDA